MWKLTNNYNFDDLAREFDWIADMKGVEQDPVHHAEGDVYTHTSMVVDALKQLPEFGDLPEQEQHLLLAAALMHDIEKRSTTVVENGTVRAPRHAAKGAFTARHFLYTRTKIPFALREQIANLVKLHGLPIWAVEKPAIERRLIRASYSVHLNHLYLLAKADALGRICADQNELLERISYFKLMCQELNCFNQAYSFPSGWTRFNYFQNEATSRYYQPYHENEFEVVLLVALPGSGKDTYVAHHFSETPVVSLDTIRREHKIKPTDQSGNGRVAQMAKAQARSYLRKKQPFVWNATNLTQQRRATLIQLFYSYGAGVRLVYLETDYAELLRRNRTREYPLPPAALERMVRKWEPPTADEGSQLDFIIHSNKKGS